jgi:hypothetical protein
MKVTPLPNGGELYEWADGTKYWYLNGRLHREDGPAKEYANGSKFWYMNDEFHREDGPAVEFSSGHKEWWIDGQYIQCTTQKEFERLLKLKAFW